MRKFLSVLLAVVLVASMAVMAVSAAETDTAAAAAGTATVTLYDLKGGSVTQTYSVGETFTAYTYLNINGLGNNRIGSLSGEQVYTSSVLELADDYVRDEDSYEAGSIIDIDTMFPIIGFGAVANGAETGIVYYNASVPSFNGGFLFNKDDCALIIAHYTVTAPGTATIVNKMTTLAQADYDLTRIFDRGVMVNDNFRTSTALSEPTLPIETGSKVSGTVTSFLHADDTVTVALVQGDTVVKSFEGTGNSLAYVIEDVADGDYILRVSKANHVTRDYDITVSGDTTADAKIHLLGDINGDGRVNSRDAALANAHAQRASLLTGYAFKCADVARNDGRVNTADTTRINLHAQRAEFLWE